MAGDEVAATLQHLKLSEIRFVALEEPTIANPPLASEWAARMRPTGYAAAFAAALSEESADAPASLPWDRGEGDRSYFWKFYLEGAPDRIAAQEAARRFVPLRRRLVPPGALTAISDPARPAPKLSLSELRLEAFYYPHGVGLVTTARLSGDGTLDEAVQAVQDLRSSRFRGFSCAGGAAVDDRGRTLEQIAERCLIDLAEEVLGGPLPAGRMDPPFTVVTLLQGRDLPVEKSVEGDQDLQRALNGLVTGLREWRLIEAPPLEECSIPLRSSPASHLLYGRDRGRAVWFPAPMVDRARRRTLGCYHRNLTMVSLQTASLLALAGAAADYLERPNGLPAAFADPARRAADLLGRLYGGKGTYRSGSALKQIDDSPHRAAVDELRRHFRGPGSELQRPGDAGSAA